MSLCKSSQGRVPTRPAPATSSPARRCPQRHTRDTLSCDPRTTATTTFGMHICSDHPYRHWPPPAGQLAVSLPTFWIPPSAPPRRRRIGHTNDVTKERQIHNIVDIQSSETYTLYDISENEYSASDNAPSLIF